jgi:hypothetical protein
VPEWLHNERRHAGKVIQFFTAALAPSSFEQRARQAVFVLFAGETGWGPKLPVPDDITSRDR